MRFATPSWQAAAGSRTAAARHPYPWGTRGASRLGAAAPLFQSVGAPLRRGPTFAAAAVAVFGNGTKYSIGICEAGGDT